MTETGDSGHVTAVRGPDSPLSVSAGLVAPTGSTQRGKPVGAPAELPPPPLAENR